MNSFNSLRVLFGLDWATARKALSFALAAWLSFSIASLLHINNAYWAAMPVWVLAQQSRGLVLERAVFRIVGTLIGAMVGFALVHIPVSPYVQLVLLALWIALNSGLTHVLRGVTGYAALLAGMTAAIVVIPSLLTPFASMDIAVARVECTLIGVIVSTLVLALLTPDLPLAAFYAQVRAVSAESVAYAARVLSQGVSADDGAEERRILGLISKLESSARLNAAGSVEGYRRLGAVDLLVVGSLSTMAAAQALRVGHDRDGRSFDAAVQASLHRIAEYLRTAWASPMPDEGRRINILGDSGLVRLDIAVGQILDADLALHHPDTIQAQASGQKPARLEAHREWLLAMQTGALAGVASFMAAAIGLWLNWPPMELAALGVCIFVMVLGSMPLPQLVAPKLLAGVVAGVVAAILYRLAVQPAITSTTGLLLSIVPFLLLGGFARANPRAGAAGVDSNMCFWLASQAGMPAIHDIGKIFIDSSVLALSAGVIAGAFILLPRRSQRQAVDAAAMIRRDLQRILESGASSDPLDWHARSSRQILRLSLHLGRAKELAEFWPNGLLAALNLGQAMIDVQQLGMPEAVKALLTALLQQKMPPQQAAKALHALADATDDDRLKRLILTLADTLVFAADLLIFGLRSNSEDCRKYTGYE